MKDCDQHQASTDRYHDTARPQRGLTEGYALQLTGTVWTLVVAVLRD